MGARRTWRAVGVIAVVAAAVAGCSSPSRPSPPETLKASTTLDWLDVGGGVDVAQLLVPRDHDEPAGKTISLYVVRHRATKPKERIGSLLVNPGGPGAPGSEIALLPEAYRFSPRLIERFDIIGWDPRGVGRSEPAVDCLLDLDPLYSLDITPDDDAERATVAARTASFVEGCEANSADLLPVVSTRQSAQDIDTIRRALGEEKVSYFGFSYGSELGSVWLTMFPATVRAAVLDGAFDPSAPEDEQTVQQALGFERAFDRLLAACSSDKKCKFHHDGKAAEAFDALMATIEREPIPTVKGRPPVSSGVALLAVATTLYDSGLWPVLYAALADAEKGKGKRLLALHDAYLGRSADGRYDNTNEVFYATSCLDGSTETADISAELLAAAPRLHALFEYPDMCDAWPVPVDPSPPVTGKGAPAIVVVGTTGDPATPIESTRAMADALEQGILVTVDAGDHTGYGRNDCVADAVDDYLVDLTAPAADLVCR